MMSKNMFVCLLMFAAFTILGRLIPHPPNVTPLISLSILSSRLWSRKLAAIFIIFVFVMSDLALSFLHHYPPFGSWTLYTYSAGLLIMYVSSQYHCKKNHGLYIHVLIAAMGFWLWTNFGVWLTGGMYTKNFQGIIDCYVAALPFLRNQLVGDILWFSIFLFSLNMLTIKTTNDKPIQLQ